MRRAEALVSMAEGPDSEALEMIGSLGVKALRQVRAAPASEKLNVARYWVVAHYSYAGDGGVGFARLVSMGNEEAIRSEYGFYGMMDAREMRLKALLW